MGKYFISDPAKADIREIVSFVRERSPSSAPKVRSELSKAMKLLSDFPGMGHVRNDLEDDSFRVWSVYSYLIIYNPEKPISILRVVHGSRDLYRAVFGT